MFFLLMKSAIINTCKADMDAGFPLWRAVCANVSEAHAVANEFSIPIKLHLLRKCY